MENEVKANPDQFVLHHTGNYADPPKELEESNIDVLRKHNVTFSFLNSGCTISVGCKTYAFSSNEEGLSEFAELVKNPKEAWKKWNN